MIKIMKSQSVQKVYFELEMKKIKQWLNRVGDKCLWLKILLLLGSLNQKNLLRSQTQFKTFEQGNKVRNP